MYFFLFAVIWVVIFKVQNDYVTGFRFLRNFVKIIQICMAYFHIKIIGWQELKLSLFKNQICQKIITQLKYEGSMKLAPMSYK